MRFLLDPALEWDHIRANFSKQKHLFIDLDGEYGLDRNERNNAATHEKSVG